jgi:hypothetical protein
MKNKKKKRKYCVIIEEFDFYPLPITNEHYKVNEKFDRFISECEIIEILYKKRESVAPEKWHFVILAKWQLP